MLGLPLASLERLLVLEKANLVSFQYVDDPTIVTAQEQGWLLKSADQSATVQIMIDTVLDSTNASEVSSELFIQLREQRIIQSVHPGIGVKVHRDATLIHDNDTRTLPPLAVLGRLAQGSLIGVDAILECFGERQDMWASGVIGRLNVKEEPNHFG